MLDIVGERGEIAADLAVAVVGDIDAKAARIGELDQGAEARRGRGRAQGSLAMLTRSRVVPAVDRQWRPCAAIRLSSEDLPTFGRPTMATRGIMDDKGRGMVVVA